MMRRAYPHAPYPRCGTTAKLAQNLILRVVAGAAVVVGLVGASQLDVVTR
jgi:hypothetical protein